MKYEEMKDKYITDQYGFNFVGNYHMLSDVQHPCGICGELTRAIDVFSEGYICSEECQQKFDNWCNEVCNTNVEYKFISDEEN